MFFFRLSICFLVIFSAYGFTERLYYDDYNPPSNDQTPPPPTPPPVPVDPYCYGTCKKIANCKDILYHIRTQPEEHCVGRMPQSIWTCLKQYQDSFCFHIKGYCDKDHIVSGFGTTEEKKKRCMPISQCKYLADIFQHVNDIHSDIYWK